MLSWSHAILVVRKKDRGFQRCAWHGVGEVVVDEGFHILCSMCSSVVVVGYAGLEEEVLAVVVL
jgi:hypothetical protein